MAKAKRSVGRLSVYVTSHGFGHLNRTVSVLNRVPGDVPITIRCHPNLFDHWRERLRREAEFHPHVSDAGAINPPGDSAATDGLATLARAAEVHREASGRVDEFAEELRGDGSAVVLCDAPYVPLVAARRAGIPGYLLANFTWADIYAPYARRAGADALRLVAEIRAAYRHATALIRVEPALAMRWLGPQIEPGIVATKGRDRATELRKTLGLGRGEKLVYFYVGRYGQDGMGWEQVAALGAKGVHFVGFHPAPVGVIANLHVVPALDWTGADLAASADAIVAKAGYGSACEAMVAGTPLIYPPRVGFAEHRVLDRALRAWGGGLPVSRRRFDGLRVGPELDRAFAWEPGPPPFPTDGAARIAAMLTGIARGGPGATALP